MSAGAKKTGGHGPPSMSHQRLPVAADLAHAALYFYSVSGYREGARMQPITIGDVKVSGITERDGPWRTSNSMFRSATPEALEQVMDVVPVKESAGTRWKFFRERADTDTLVIPAYFPAATAGHIRRRRDTREFQFLGD